MRSAYVKISLWSLAILICSSVLFVVISRNNVYRSFGKDGELGHRLVSQSLGRYTKRKEKTRSRAISSRCS